MCDSLACRKLLRTIERKHTKTKRVIATVHLRVPFRALTSNTNNTSTHSVTERRIRVDLALTFSPRSSEAINKPVVWSNWNYPSNTMHHTFKSSHRVVTSTRYDVRNVAVAVSKKRLWNAIRKSVLSCLVACLILASLFIIYHNTSYLLQDVTGLSNSKACTRQHRFEYVVLVLCSRTGVVT